MTRKVASRRLSSRMQLSRISLLFGALFLAGCTSDGGDTAEVDALPTGTSATEYAIAFDNPGSDDFDKLLEPDDDLVQIETARILDVETADTDQLLLSFEMESHHCFGVRPSVAETENEVVVELVVGRRPEIALHRCDYGVFPYTTMVQLAAPLGERTLVVAELSEPNNRRLAGLPIGGTVDEGTPGGSSQQVAANETDWLLGSHVEDGVEWAISNGYEWRVVSFDGAEVDGHSDGLAAVAWIGFRVEGDLIVAYEWY